MPKYEPKIKYTEKAKSDKGTIYMGLVLFVVIMLVGTVYNVINGRADAAPKPAKPALAKHCVKPAAWMRAHHMKLLDEWRNEVVREGKRGSIVVDGKRYEKSLTKGCMKCHESKARFCDQCHHWAGVNRPGVEISCWHCHIVPNQPHPAAKTAGR